MKNKIIAFALILMMVSIVGCRSGQRGNSIPLFPDRPTRTAYEGFQWETVSGAGLKFWAQYNAHIRMVTDDSIPGAQIEWSDRKESRQTVIRLFPLKNGKIEDLLSILSETPEWNDSIDCSFIEKQTDRPGVKRYVLTPTGEYAEKIKRLGALEPIPSTCGGWGIGNSGIRYFEIHDNRPDIALFIEIGQEFPLFDEESIVVSEDFELKPKAHSLRTVGGTLIIGHEVRSFVADGDTTAYWVVDKTGKLYPTYDSLTKGTKRGSPVRAKLVVQNIGKSEEGFAADYASVYLVKEIIRMEK